ncbi:unnamed protein product [Tuber aestivum]|uniref:K Homology domain-containing protein n=1 Tax=Tuber aestivum TaxID=59557 RepID=A0A292Q1J9_9PEZI|nr:unnamed protein product [Tuber aestivum]
MPPSSYASNLATRLCRQFRRPSRIHPAYTRCFSVSTRQCSEEKTRSETIDLEPLSEFLILRTPGPPKPRHESLQLVRDPLEPEVLDDAQKQLLQPEDLDAKNIDIELVRPLDVVRVSKERYVQLAQQLSKAFVKPQLFEYYHTTVSGESAPPKLISTSNKREIINAILSVKWGITVSDEIPERLDVLVNRDFPNTRRDIFFILGKDGRVVRQLSQEYQARVKVNIKSGSISVNATLENYERLRKAIQDLLEKVTVKEFDMSWAQRLCKFNEQFITPIARITGTYIEKKDEKTLLISTLDPGSLQDARRLLFVSFDLRLRSSHSLLYNAPKGRGDPKGALYPVHEKSALPWNFRDVEWGRWRNIKMQINHPGRLRRGGSAILKDTLRTRIGGELKDTDTTTTGLREILDYNDLRVSAQHRSELLTRYEAVLGYLLHENSDPQPAPDLTAPEFVESKDRLQVFLTDVPGLFHFTQGLPPISDPISKDGSSSLRAQGSTTSRQQAPYQTCIVKLLPSPWEYPECFDRYPPLELKFNIDPDIGNVVQPTLQAIHSSTIADAMFPSEECDVRFHCQKALPLGILGDPANPQPDYGVAGSELQRYLSESALNPLTDIKLKASQYLSVGLPEWMISPSKSSESGGEGEERSLPTQMNYISTGLEYRHELAFSWKGMKLYQTVVQGGVTGGRRSEFKLCWNNSGEDDSSAQAPRITELEGDDKVVDEIAEGSRGNLAVETAPGAVMETVVVSNTEAAGGIPSEPALGTGVEDAAGSGDRITEPTIDQSLQHTPRDPCYPPKPRPSFADFIMGATHLVECLGKFVASREWRFTTQSKEHTGTRVFTKNMGHGGGEGAEIGRGGQYRGAVGRSGGGG